MEDEGRGMHCLEWKNDDPILIAGNWETGNQITLDLSFLPCNVNLSSTNDQAEGCVPDKDKQIEYLGPVSLVLMYNNVRMDPLGFNKDSLVYESRIDQIQIDEKSPNYVLTKVIDNLLEDETDYL